MKLNNAKTLTGVLLALFFAASCEDVPEIPVNVNLGVTPKEVTIPAEGGRASVSFNSPLAWETSCSEDWLQISPGSGQPGDIVLTLSAGANESTDQRSATVTVKVTGTQFSETVKVIQTGAEPPFVPSVELSQTSFDAGATGGELSVSVISNLDWSASADASWIRISPASGKEGTTAVTLTVAANQDLQSRSATVTFKGDGVSAALAVQQSAGTMTEITGFAGSIQDWADGGGITIPSGGQNPATEDSWQVFLPVEGRLLDMAKGQDGIFTAEIMDHYPTMRIFLVKEGKDVFGSVYYAAYMPGQDGVYTSALALTSNSAYSLYVPVDGPVSVSLDTKALSVSFREIPQEWKTIGSCRFTDGFITYIWDLEMGPMDVEIQKKGELQEYRLVNPYAELWKAYPEEFSYEEGGDLVFRIKDDNTVYFKETYTGVILPEYGAAWVMSAVPEAGWSSYSYYGTWDQASSTVICDKPAVIYLEGVGRYYLTNSDGLMRIVLPAVN